MIEDDDHDDDDDDDDEEDDDGLCNLIHPSQKLWKKTTELFCKRNSVRMNTHSSMSPQNTTKKLCVF